MKSKKPTISLFLDQRRALDSGTYPIKITVYFEGDKRRYNTGISITVDDFNKMNSERLRDDNLKKTKRKLQVLVENCETFIESQSEFSFISFADYFLGKNDKETRIETKTRAKLETLFDEYINMLNKEGRIGTSEMYVTVRNSLLKLKSNLSIEDVTTEFLKSYEQFLQGKNSSPSTIGIYMRHLRAIINYSIKEKILPANNYPFKGFKIPSSRNIKKALNFDDLKILLNYNPENPKEEKALDFWMFSYLCNGMNMKDICQLKWENIDGDFLFYFRAKTINTKKNDLRPIKVFIPEQAKEILNRQGNKLSKAYVFTVLNETLTPKQIDSRIHSFIKQVNEGMELIRQNLGIEMALNSYSARHSHATVLKRQGVSIEAISENLGHSSLLMTKQYLDDFTDDVKKENATFLTNF